jgi:hypothetical protein
MTNEELNKYYPDQIEEIKFKHFDNMAWPIPPEGLSWKLRHGNINRADKLSAAAIIDAYKGLINCNKTEREYVVKNLKSR